MKKLLFAVGVVVLVHRGTQVPSTTTPTTFSDAGSDVGGAPAPEPAAPPSAEMADGAPLAPAAPSSFASDVPESVEELQPATMPDR